MTPLETTATIRNGITVLAVAGRLDSLTAADLEREINSRIDGGSRRILLNLSQVIYISSAGLRVLLAAAKRLRTAGDRFGICGLTAEVHKVLKLSGFTSLFPIYGSEEEALGR